MSKIDGKLIFKAYTVNYQNLKEIEVKKIESLHSVKYKTRHIIRSCAKNKRKSKRNNCGGRNIRKI